MNGGIGPAAERAARSKGQDTKDVAIFRPHNEDRILAIKPDEVQSVTESDGRRGAGVDESSGGAADLEGCDQVKVECAGDAHGDAVRMAPVNSFGQHLADVAIKHAGGAG